MLIYETHFLVVIFGRIDRFIQNCVLNFISMAMVLSMGAMTAFADEATIAVTINANGGKFATGTGVSADGSTYTTNVTVDSDATTVNIGWVDGIPSIAAPNSNKAFKYWSTSANASAENLEATISSNAATFYAVWETVETGNRTLDGKISVSGLETGDKVNFYQILKFDQNASETKGWVATDAFAYNEDTNPNGLTVNEIKTILNIGTQENPGISADLAAKIAKLVADKNISPATGYANIAESSGTASKDSPDAGLYMALVTPGQSGVIYNPVFVGADYEGNTSNTWALVNLETSYSPESIAKKTKITLDKTAETTEEAFEDTKPESVAVGDTVTFRVETTIPTFADNYTQARFFVEDHLSKGFTLTPDSVKVYKDWYSEAADKENFAINDNVLSKEYDITTSMTQHKSDGYTVSYGENNGSSEYQDNYTVDFATGYLLRDNAAAQKITIIYTAKVTTAAPRSLNIENNTVEVHYSNSPSDGTGDGKLKDETKHYTFDIDANIFGPDGVAHDGKQPWQTTEVVKVGLDKDGNEITQTTTLHGETLDGATSEQTIGALQGAEFLLYKAKNAAGDQPDAFNASSLYTNDIMKTDYKIVSDATGRLTIQNKDASTGNYVAETIPGIRGLDIGTYYLVETKAPDGYIKQQDPVKIEIIAPQPDWSTATSNNYWELKEYQDPTTPAAGDVVVKWKVKELKKYDVKINGQVTGTYTFTNNKSEEDSEPSATITNKGDTVTGSTGGIASGDANTSDHRYGKITNTQGTELPSTGGIGTTIFYIVGTMLVLGAGVVLITRRRMDA